MISPCQEKKYEERTGFICAKVWATQSWKCIPLGIMGNYLQDVDNRSTIQTALQSILAHLLAQMVTHYVTTQKPVTRTS